MWTLDDDNDGLGQILMRRVHFTGDPGLGSDDMPVTGTTNHAWPTVSSLLDEPMFGGRPVVVVFETHRDDVTRPNGMQSDVDARTFSDDELRGSSFITSSEDAARPLLQRRPQVATNGDALFISYLEEDPAQLNQGVYDGYMATGNVTQFFTQARIALAERHLPLMSDSASETSIALATRWEGDALVPSPDGAAVWARENGNGEFGQVEGAGFRYFIPTFLTARAVGVQYGDANDNSVGNGNSGWLRILGDQSSDQPHLAHAIDLPPNSFGYLLVADDVTNVNMPAGSQGRLLIGGSVGRFVNAIQSSGSDGRIDTVIDPTSLPQPNGPVAVMAGEPWLFQLWHRDTSNGMPTSNFTNAATVYFVQ